MVRRQLILVGIGGVSDMGRYRRRDRHNQVHSMLMSWASHLLVMQGSSEGQGYTIVLLDVTGGGLPSHSLIPRGVEYTTEDDMRINEFFDAGIQKGKGKYTKKVLGT